MAEAVVGEWKKHDKKCPCCGGDTVIKKNRTGAMATVKHETPNPSCNLKMWSEKHAGKKGTERTEEENKNGKSKSSNSTNNNTPPGKNTAGTPGQSDTDNGGTGRKSGTSVDDGQAPGKNKGDDKSGESYGDYLKSIYGK